MPEATALTAAGRLAKAEAAPVLATLDRSVFSPTFSLTSTLAPSLANTVMAPPGSGM
ncbi:MAG TPA: hypothetical protein VN714_23675 [Trebonia sp.]|nr:hypothetical protein [Trebonia sp.]